MLKNSDIEEFYKRIERLDLKFPVAEIAKATGYSKGNVSDFMKKRKTPSEGFIKRFYSSFPDSTPMGPDNALPAGGYTVTLEDYIREIKAHNKFLQDLLTSKVEKMDSNLSTALGGVLQLSLHVESAREVVLKSLARLEKKPQDSLRNEADKIVIHLMTEHEKYRKSVETGR